jgi:ribose 5-phosphate isomerase B
MIYLGADHAGFKLKERVKKYLDKKNIAYEDLGNFGYDKNDDYPDYGHLVASSVARTKKSTGILFCGSSYGACIVANKTPGIRAVSVRDVHDAKLARAHDHANVMCLSGWSTTTTSAKKFVNVWLKTKQSKATRHVRRVNKIKKIEK